MKTDLYLLTGTKKPSVRKRQIEEILTRDFNVTRCYMPDLTPAKLNEGTRFYVVIDPIGTASLEVLFELMSRVRNKDAVLLLIGEALFYDDNPALYALCNVRGIARNEKRTIDVRVFPHVLSRGLNEEETLDAGVIYGKLFKQETRNDNVFMRLKDQTPVAFEEVYGQKGRVVSLLVTGQESEAPLKLEERILKNLHYLSNTAEDVDQKFKNTLQNVLPLEDEWGREDIWSVGRWNTLAAPQHEGAAVYTQSSVFLPLSPGHYKKNLRHLESRNLRALTQEDLRRCIASVEIQNTDSCNQDCYYCYNRKSMDIGYQRTQLSDEVHRQLEEDILALKRGGAGISVRYTGKGEPLCHNRTLPSLIQFEEAGIPTILVTNGMALDKQAMQSLAGRASCLRFSIDAAKDETYRRIRRCGEGMLNQLISNIHRTQMLGTLLGATFLICRENYQEIYDFCAKMKMAGVHIVWLRSTNDPEAFGDSEMAHITRLIQAAELLIDDQFIIFHNQFTVYRNINALHYRYSDTPCWAAYLKSFIRPNGDVIVCLSHDDFVIGNLNERPFSEIWGGKKHLTLLREKDWNECSSCVESRFNASVNFLNNYGKYLIVKATREIELTLG
jgi:sulfatase maturation enzyme AslB (radical SAM superfamily)